MEGIFDVVASGVDEDARVIPAGTLHTHVLMHCTQTLQLAVADSQSCEKGGRGVSEGGREEGGGRGRREEGGREGGGTVEREGYKRYGGRKMRIYTQRSVRCGYSIHSSRPTVPAQDGNVAHVRRPHHVLGLGHPYTVERPVGGGGGGGGGGGNDGTPLLQYN